MAKAISTPHYTTFFCARKTLRVFLIGHKKTSFTFYRYVQFGFELVDKIEIYVYISKLGG
jgi:hypothetical protein